MSVVRLSSLLVIAGLVAPVKAGTPGVKVWQASDQALTEGETTLEGEAADIYKTCLDYTRWTDIFPERREGRDHVAARRRRAGHADLAHRAPRQPPLP